MKNKFNQEELDRRAEEKALAQEIEDREEELEESRRAGSSESDQDLVDIYHNH